MNYEFQQIDAALSGILSVVDNSFADFDHSLLLDGDKILDLGLTAANDSDLNMNIAIQNLTDEGALTEGDAPKPTAPNGRFILPRTVTLVWVTLSSTTSDTRI
jgi:iron complex outermembrane receptor protein